MIKIKCIVKATRLWSVSSDRNNHARLSSNFRQRNLLLIGSMFLLANMAIAGDGYIPIAKLPNGTVIVLLEGGGAAILPEKQLADFVPHSQIVQDNFRGPVLAHHGYAPKIPAAVTPYLDLGEGSGDLFILSCNRDAPRGVGDGLTWAKATGRDAISLINNGNKDLILETTKRPLYNSDTGEQMVGFSLFRRTWRGELVGVPHSGNWAKFTSSGEYTIIDPTQEVSKNILFLEPGKIIPGQYKSGGSLRSCADSECTSKGMLKSLARIQKIAGRPASSAMLPLQAVIEITRDGTRGMRDLEAKYLVAYRDHKKVAIRARIQQLSASWGIEINNSNFSSKWEAFSSGGGLENMAAAPLRNCFERYHKTDPARYLDVYGISPLSASHLMGP